MGRSAKADGGGGKDAPEVENGRAGEGIGGVEPGGVGRCGGAAGIASRGGGRRAKRRTRLLVLSLAAVA